MNKKLKTTALCTLSLTMAIGLATTVSAATSTATLSATNLQVDGEAVAVQAYMIDGNNYIKLRDLATMINGTENNFAVTWNSDLSSIELQSGTAYTTTGSEMAMDGAQTTTATLSTSPIYVDGSLVDLTAYNISDNNYFKLRDVMGLFDVAVGYDSASNTATLTTGGASESVVDDTEEEVVVEEVVVENAVYTYNYPDAKKPSDEMTMSWEYFYEIGNYLLFSGEETFAVTFPGYTRDQLISDTDFVDCRLAAADYLYGQHIDLWSFYSYVGYSYTKGTDTTLTFYLAPKDTYDTDDIDQFQSQVSDLVTSFFTSGALHASDSETVKARYIYNWVCDNTVYGSNTSDPYNGYITLQTGEGVCMGYAGLLNAMLRTAGIESYGVGCSSLANGAGHTINTAKLDGSWVYIDATFGDTGNNYDKYFAMNRDTVNQIYSLDYKWA